MSARDEILARARAALAGTPPPGPVPGPVPRNYQRQGTWDPAALRARFADRVRDYQADVSEVDLDRLAAEIARRLAGTRTLIVPADAPGDWLSAYSGWLRRDQPPVPRSELDAPGVSVLTTCAVAIAETGTIGLDAGPGQGRRVLTLVPDHHVCVVPVDRIVATVPEALARLADPTRPLTLISGPSATSDIELDRVEGVHGPRRLDVIITR